MDNFNHSEFLLGIMPPPPALYFFGPSCFDSQKELRKSWINKWFIFENEDGLILDDAVTSLYKSSSI